MYKPADYEDELFEDGPGGGELSDEYMEFADLPLEAFEFEDELADEDHEGGPPPDTQWPKGSWFKPQPGTIPSGPYKTSPVACQDPYLDMKSLQRLFRTFSARILAHRKLLKQKPRNQAEIARSLATARKEFTTIKLALIAMRRRTKDGSYLKTGCSPRDIAKITCVVRKFSGPWQQAPTLKRLWEQLVFDLRNARGAFAKVWCNKL